jgi:nitroreductase
MRPTTHRAAIASLLLAAALLAPSAHAAVKKMFVTSASGNAKLENWPVIAGQGRTGADAGDAICQTLAANAGLANAGAFRAWLSTTADDAFCRVRTSNGAGTKAGRCGGIDPIFFSLFTGGPWVRTDGYPFSLDELDVTNRSAVLTPGVLDENGDDVQPAPGVSLAWTGTDDEGVAFGGRCGDWISGFSGSTTTYGAFTNTTSGWSNRGTASCDQIYHLYCFETGTNGSALPSFEVPGALAFVTAGAGSGNLGAWMGAQGTGLAAADATCQRSARSTGLPHPDSFHAWLSTSTVDAIDRLTIDGPWKRLDGVQIASSKADLGDGRLFSTITQDEYGEYRPGEVVWTGTLGDGTSSGETCSDWTNGTAASTGRSGTSSVSLSSWTNGVERDCVDDDAVPRHLYCFSDVVIDFWDGFESGWTRRWSGTFP